MSSVGSFPATSVPPAIVVPQREIPKEHLMRLTLDQYHAMVNQGILASTSQVEFLEGLLVKKVTKNRAHSRYTRRLRIVLEQIVPAGYYVDSQEPTTTRDSEPEPDAMVIRGGPDDYQDRQPEAKDVPLVAEVADSSLFHDRTWKKRIYARAAIPVYWIVNLVDRQIEIYTLPSGPAEQPDYASCQVIAAADEAPLILDGREVGRIAVKDVLP